MIKWITIAFALLGLGLGLYTVATARHDPPRAPLAAAPSVNPYAHGIAGTGTIEASTRNLQLTAPEGGLVSRVFVEVGQQVDSGDPLFELDTRPLQAELLRARAQIAAAEAQVRRLEAAPRAEEVPPLEAAVSAAEADLADWTEQYERYSRASQQGGGTDVEARIRYFGMESARARLEEARARLALLQAGTWSADLEVARAELAAAQASAAAVELLIERRTVRAPLAGTILKRNIEPGQFAPAEPRSAAMILGDLSVLHVRAQIDEEDLPTLREGAAGTARVRGSTAITFPLEMVRIEPFAAPKTELSGATMERVDTRVVEVIFRIDQPPEIALYPGQLVDVYVESQAPAAAPPPPADSGS